MNAPRYRYRIITSWGRTIEVASPLPMFDFLHELKTAGGILTPEFYVLASAVVGIEAIDIVDAMAEQQGATRH